MPVPLEKFVKQLEDSGVLAGDTLKDFIPPKASPKNAEELALELVRKKKLTKFQAEEVSKGKGKSLVLGNYVLMEKIGAGGMGQVFKAEHRRMHRIVAIKVLPPNMTKDAAAIARFEREVTAAAKINHPNIVTAYDADQSGGVHFLVMELVDGTDLSVLVKKNGPFPIEKAIRYVLQAARGLEAAHRKGIVHRDIKPANLLLDLEGTVKILDMGLARLSGDGDDVPQADLTSTGTVMGTVDYMSPEQALDTKTADARADIYALGCSLFYLLTGTPAYQGDTIMKKLLAHREHAIPSLRSSRAEVPEQIDAVFKKLVAKKIEDRYQTMTEVIAALEGCGRGQLNTVVLHSSDTGQTGLGQDKSGSSRTMTLPPATREAVVKSNGSSANKSVESYQEADFTEFLGNLPSAPSRPIRAKKLVKKGKKALLNGQKKLLVIGGAVLGVMILLAAVVMRLKTNDGTLVVTVSEPDADVQVLNDKNTVEITRNGEKSPIRITVVPGKHRLKVQKDGFEIFTDSFEMKSGNTEAITAKLVPLEQVAVVEAVTDHKPWDSPDFKKWMKDVQAMPAEKQVEAVSRKLMELNPSFDGKISSWNESIPPVVQNGNVVELQIFTDKVADLSPIRALSELRELSCSQRRKTGRRLDLSPLKGMRIRILRCAVENLDLSMVKGLGLPLTDLAFLGAGITDLTPVSGMPIQGLTVSGNWGITSLEPLKGMPLTSLFCDNSQVADLSPLSGMRLTHLICHVTKVADLTPLNGMPLEELYCHQTLITDLSPLADMKLKKLSFTPSPELKGLPAIRKMDSLVEIGIAHDKLIPRDEFWKKYDEGAFNSLGDFRPVTDVNSPEFQKWMSALQSLRAEDQIEAVRKKLKELNPGFDGKLTDGEGKPPFIENGVVKRLGFATDNVIDISPVRALTGLYSLDCSGSAAQKGQLSDLSPIKAMPLAKLSFSNTKVSDLSPLRGMPIWLLVCAGTPVTDLSPLEGMPLTNLVVAGTKISDLAALKGMNLKFFACNGTIVSDISPLREMQLNFVHFLQTKVADLSPLRGSRMSLTIVGFSDTPVSDLSPLEGMKLTQLFFTPKNITQGIDVVRKMKSIERFGTRGWGEFPAEEFWKKYDAGEFGKPASPENK